MRSLQRSVRRAPCHTSFLDWRSNPVVTRGVLVDQAITSDVFLTRCGSMEQQCKPVSVHIVRGQISRLTQCALCCLPSRCASSVALTPKKNEHEPPGLLCAAAALRFCCLLLLVSGVLVQGRLPGPAGSCHWSPGALSEALVLLRCVEVCPQPIFIIIGFLT